MRTPVSLARPTVQSLALVLALLVLAVSPAAGQERGGAVRVQGIRVTAGDDWCPRRDDARARRLWAALVARYDAGADTASLWTPLLNSTASGPATAIALPERIVPDPNPQTDHGWNVSVRITDADGRTFMIDRAEAQGAGERGMNGLWRREWRVRMERGGYARPYSPAGTASGDISGVYERWQYAPLEGELATHFLEPAFGERHVFGLEDGPRGPEIRFCGARRERARPWLMGTLHLSPDTTLRRADWRFRVPEGHGDDGDEGAGGLVEFAPVPPSAPGPVPLLPTRGVFYRRQSLQYLVRQQIFGGWRMGPRAAWIESLRDERPRAPGGA